jgi:Reverse transcriptase (RNA-dependent DNA polymerase)
MDSHTQPALHVHRLDGTIMKFVEHPSGLYVYDPNASSATVEAYTMVSTVAEQKKFFSNREIKDADAARELYRKLGRPDEAEFQTILKNNLLRNCPVTPADARRALIIYGPDVAVIKGKTTRTEPAPRVPTFEAVPIPPPVLAHHRNVTLCADFFYVQGLVFFHTISRHLGFRTVRPVPDRGKPVILKELRHAISLYQHRGFDVRDVHGDHEFECIRDEIRPIELNIVPADCHVGEVERSIRTIKERLRTCVHGLPFARLPKLLIRHMVDDVIRNLNQFPWKNGVSNTISPAGLVAGTALPDFTKLRLEFGSYVQVFEDNEPTNTPRARSLGAIAMNPTGNAQGDYYFMSLATGARISRRQWTALPMTDTAIARVEALAMHDEQPLIQERGFVIEWRPDHPIDDSEYDRDYVLPRHQPADVPIPDAALDPVDADELGALLADAAAHDLLLRDPVDDYVPLDQGANDADMIAAAAANPWIFEHGEHGAEAAIVEMDDGDDDENNNDANENDNDANDASDDDEDEHGADFDNNDDGNDDADGDDNQGAPNEGARNAENAPNQGAPNEGAPNDDDDDESETEELADDGPAYHLRARGPTQVRFQDAMDYPHDGKSYYPPTQLLQQGTLRTHGNIDATRRHIYGFIMTQMTARAGIKKHGQRAEAALMREFAQFENLGVYEAVDATKLTYAERKGALRAINLIKEKRDGEIKGRTVADGSGQRSLYDKSETASPTVSTNALVLTIIVDAYENRDVGTADVAGAYLKADMKDFVIMKFTGESVDILCTMNPAHVPFVVVEHGKKVLYVRLIKAIYGCVQSALLWYKLFYGTLQKMGFVLNPYDPCIANCMIDGKQCTIAWYVDDMKISHVDPEVVTNIIEILEGHFDKMTVTRGKEHVFLGMNIRYTEERTAVVTMKQYLQEALDECGMEITREAATPARKNLFDVDAASKTLGQAESERFHHTVAKLLYVAIRARMDLLLTNGFLCTRVSKSTEQDLRKLRRLLEYIKGSIDLEYTLGADNMTRLRTWVDASYAVHPDMKSHTGGVMSLGTGGIVCKSTKQKLNTKSSTEAELVGASDYLPNTLWVKLFLEAQGHKIDENFFEQDNESAIKLETNGRRSAGPMSRHIDIRYFWIKDRTEQAGITIRHCPTLQMLGDFFTKPLQGNLFRKFRAVVLGYEHVDSLALDPMPSVEERVGEVRSDGRGTDGPDADGFVLVLAKKVRKRKNRMQPANDPGARGQECMHQLNTVSRITFSKQSC